MNKRVVITGIGIVSPLGLDAAAHWSNLCAGKVAVDRLRLFDPAGMPCQLAAQVPDYKIADFVPKSYRKGTKLMARDIELAVIAADVAFKDAGIKSKAHVDPPAFPPARFGCNIGAGLISCELNELTAALHLAREGDQLDLKKWGSVGMPELTPLWLLKYLPNMLACHVTIVHGLMGPSNTITCQEASAHLAIGEAFRTLQRGKADLAICGGAESRLNPMGLVRQQLLKRLCETCNEEPATAVRPFDQSASGTVFGEGGGLLILEELEHARSRGARIYAEVAGFAASQDVHSVTEPDPEGLSYTRAIQRALKDARLDASDVDLIIPNGVGIPSADKSELNGLSRAFGDRMSSIPISPIKSQIGCLGAGCGVDAATAVLSIHHGRVPPAVNTRNLIGNSNMNLATTAREAKVRTAVSTVTSVGGQNAALVFRALD